MRNNPECRGQIRFFISLLVFLFVLLLSGSWGNAMVISGPITASSVLVTGSVQASSMTVSTLTVTGQMTAPPTTAFPGLILQIYISSTTTPTITSSTTFYAVNGMSSTVQLSSSQNLIRITLAGNLFASDGTQPPYVTLKRDGINLGDMTYGMSGCLGGGISISCPVGLKFYDYPQDTNSHIYQVFVRSSNSSLFTSFPYESVGYLVLEEISR